MVIQGGIDHQCAPVLAARSTRYDYPRHRQLTGEIENVIECVERIDNDLISRDLVLRVAVEAAHDPQPASALDACCPSKGRRVVSTILAQAAVRVRSGRLGLVTVADVIVAMGLLRVVSGQRVDANFVRQV